MVYNVFITMSCDYENIKLGPWPYGYSKKLMWSQVGTNVDRLLLFSITSQVGYEFF